MAWADTGLAGSTGNASNNNSNVVVTLNAQVGVGSNANDLLVLAVGVNNFSSVSNADEGAVTSVTDTNSNTWTKFREITQGNAATTVGTVCSVWYSRTNTALTTANTVTANFSNNTARDGATALVRRFTVQGGVFPLDSTYVISATSSFPSVDLAANADSVLRMRAVAARTTLTSMTTTAGWTSLGTTRASATVNQAIFGEFIISAATTAASAPKVSAAAQNASVYVVFREDQLVAQSLL